MISTVRVNRVKRYYAVGKAKGQRAKGAAAHCTSHSRCERYEARHAPAVHMRRSLTQCSQHSRRATWHVRCMPCGGPPGAAVPDRPSCCSQWTSCE